MAGDQELGLSPPMFRGWGRERTREGEWEGAARRWEESQENYGILKTEWTVSGGNPTFSNLFIWSWGFRW